MNYIRHLNTFFSYIKTDNRLTASHVSLYMALFHYWNFNRFQNPFSIYRENIMQLSKIGSKNTYHKCIKELHQAKYIFYHPAPSKFQVVRISMVRLDTEPEKQTRYEQLDLFTTKESLPLKGGDLEGGFSTNIDTDSVPKLGQHSTDFDTVPVSKMGHLIKQTNKHRETPTHEIFKKNDKIQKAINDMGSVPNSGHIPTQHEVQTFFAERNYPDDEAKKFFNHYKAIGWKIQGKTPIVDWKPLVEKWMQNAKRWDDKKQQLANPAVSEISYLYECFLEGKKIFHQITVSHFDQLKLQLDEETLQQARQERINQVSGTNQHSLIELWKAYLLNDPANHLVQKDEPNRIALAKRIAVIKYFHSLKHTGTTSLPP